MAASPAANARPVFYYDLGSPACYLAAEAVMGALPMVPEWEPVLAAELAAGSQALERARIEQLALELGIQRLRWPRQWPPDARLAMRAATYAKGIGRAVAFSLAAFRQEFAAGRDIGDEDTVLIAGAACEMHPTALLKGIELRSVSEALAAAGVRARGAGVTSLPAIQVDGSVFEGDHAVSEAAEALR